MQKKKKWLDVYNNTVAVQFSKFLNYSKLSENIKLYIKCNNLISTRLNIGKIVSFFFAWACNYFNWLELNALNTSFTKSFSSINQIKNTSEFSRCNFAGTKSTLAYCVCRVWMQLAGLSLRRHGFKLYIFLWKKVKNSLAFKVSNSDWRHCHG